MFSQAKEDSVKVPCFWIISYLSELETKDIIEDIVKSDLVNLICKDYLIESETVVPAVRIIGNLAGNEDIFVEYLINNDVLNFFRKIINIESDCLRKEMYWAISNLTATCKNAIMKFLDDDLIIPISKKLLHSNVYYIKEEVLFFIGGIASNADYLIAKKIMDWKLDEDLVLILKENKNPDLLSLVFGIIYELISLSLFTKKETGKINFNHILFLNYYVNFCLKIFLCFRPR